MSDKLSIIPWNAEGLRFQCTGCGKCCTGQPGYVWLTQNDIARLAVFCQLDETQFKQKYIRLINNRYSLIEKPVTHDCIFLKDRFCSVYNGRPAQCRTYPFWKENLSSEKQWKAAAQVCEGISPNAPLIPWDIIEKECAEENG